MSDTAVEVPITELLDDFEGAVEMLGTSLRNDINELYEDRRDTARKALQSFVARLESENERLKETALTERERLHVIRRIEYAYQDSSNCQLCPAILEKLRRISSTGETKP